MNKQKMLELADFIENLDRWRFNIGFWASDFSKGYYTPTSNLDVNICNTAGCIAGWAMAMENGGEVTMSTVVSPEMANYNVFSGARILGLTFAQASRLFYVDPDSIWVQYWEMYKHLIDIEDIEEIEAFSDYHGSIDSEKLGDKISNKVAAFMLRQIANGEFYLSNEWRP
jgi:hypothetical protein